LVEPQARSLVLSLSGNAIMEDVRILAGDEFRGREAGGTGGNAAALWLFGAFKRRVGGVSMDHFPFLFRAVPSHDLYVDSPGDLRGSSVLGYSGFTAGGRYLLAWCGAGSLEEVEKAGSSVPAGTPWVALMRRGSLYLGEKVLYAQAAGARGVIVYNYEGGPFRGSLVWSDRIDPTAFEVGAVSITREQGAFLLGRMGMTESSPPGAAPAGTTVYMRVSASCEWRTGLNVWCKIDGDEEPGRYVIVGAHYDHLGEDPSLPDPVYNGANDNASGVAVLLALAEALAESGDGPDASVVFVAFSAEEHGLWGSRSFVAQHPEIVRNADIMINLDQVGAGDLPGGGGAGDRLYVEETASDDAQWAAKLAYGCALDLEREGLIRLGDAPTGADAESARRPGGRAGPGRVALIPCSHRTDAESFAAAGVRAVGLCATGDLSPLYHTPEDETETLDPSKLEAAARTAALVTYLVAENGRDLRVPRGPYERCDSPAPIKPWTPPAVR
jgi:hypothetical protein